MVTKISGNQGEKFQGEKFQKIPWSMIGLDELFKFMFKTHFRNKNGVFFKEKDIWTKGFWTKEPFFKLWTRDVLILFSVWQDITKVFVFRRFKSSIDGML